MNTEDQLKTLSELLGSATVLVAFYRESVLSLTELCEDQQKTLLQQQETIQQLRGKPN